LCGHTWRGELQQHGWTNQRLKTWQTNGFGSGSRLFRSRVRKGFRVFRFGFRGGLVSGVGLPERKVERAAILSRRGGRRVASGAEGRSASPTLGGTIPALISAYEYVHSGRSRGKHFRLLWDRGVRAQGLLRAFAIAPRTGRREKMPMWWFLKNAGGKLDRGQMRGSLSRRNAGSIS